MRREQRLNPNGTRFPFPDRGNSSLPSFPLEIQAPPQVIYIQQPTTFAPPTNPPLPLPKIVKWAAIESDLSPIPVNIKKVVLLGRCSKDFPYMKWARIVTNHGSSGYLDLNKDYRVQFNCLRCGKNDTPTSVHIDQHEEYCWFRGIF